MKYALVTKFQANDNSIAEIVHLIQFFLMADYLLKAKTQAFGTVAMLDGMLNGTMVGNSIPVAGSAFLS